MPFEQFQFLAAIGVPYCRCRCRSEGLRQHIADRGSKFDVASRPEIEQLLRLGITGDRISYGNPIKKAKDIAGLRRKERGRHGEMVAKMFEDDLAVERVDRGLVGVERLRRARSRRSTSAWNWLAGRSTKFFRVRSAR
mgnify:CR=1 FL=1